MLMRVVHVKALNPYYVRCELAATVIANKVLRFNVYSTPFLVQTLMLILTPQRIECVFLNEWYVCLRTFYNCSFICSNMLLICLNLFYLNFWFSSPKTIELWLLIWKSSAENEQITLAWEDQQIQQIKKMTHESQPSNSEQSLLCSSIWIRFWTGNSPRTRYTVFSSARSSSRFKTATGGPHTRLTVFVNSHHYKLHCNWNQIEVRRTRMNAV